MKTTFNLSLLGLIGIFCMIQSTPVTHAQLPEEANHTHSVQEIVPALAGEADVPTSSVWEVFQKVFIRLVAYIIFSFIFAVLYHGGLFLLRVTAWPIPLWNLLIYPTICVTVLYLYHFIGYLLDHLVQYIAKKKVYEKQEPAALERFSTLAIKAVLYGLMVWGAWAAAKSFRGDRGIGFAVNLIHFPLYDLGGYLFKYIEKKSSTTEQRSKKKIVRVGGPLAVRIVMAIIGGLFCTLFVEEEAKIVVSGIVSPLFFLLSLSYSGLNALIDYLYAPRRRKEYQA